MSGTDMACAATSVKWSGWIRVCSYALAMPCLADVSATHRLYARVDGRVRVTPYPYKASYHASTPSTAVHACTVLLYYCPTTIHCYQRTQSSTAANTVYIDDSLVIEYWSTNEATGARCYQPTNVLRDARY
eukprot:743141-Rhodomonas_salina.5